MRLEFYCLSWKKKGKFLNHESTLFKGTFSDIHITRVVVYRYGHFQKQIFQQVIINVYILNKVWHFFWKLVELKWNWNILSSEMDLEIQISLCTFWMPCYIKCRLNLIWRYLRITLNIAWSHNLLTKWYVV